MKTNHLESKSGRKLTSEQVVAIFQMKTRKSSSHYKPITSLDVAARYGVCEKTIRDIWQRRSWAHETWHLDTDEPFVKKTRGRPKGAKDQRPRRQRPDPFRDSPERLDPSSADCPQDSAAAQQRGRGRFLAPASPPQPTAPRPSASIDDQLHEWDRRGSFPKFAVRASSSEDMTTEIGARPTPAVAPLPAPARFGGAAET